MPPKKAIGESLGLFSDPRKELLSQSQPNE
jgi:hypothetical protein